MAKAGFRVLDSDLHIIEPPDLWDRYIDAPFKHQAPRGFAEWVLDLRIEIDGKLMPANVAYSPSARGHSSTRDRERFRPFHERGWSAEAQLDAMDEEGIDVGVIYPTRGLFAQGIDGMEPKLAAAIRATFNRRQTPVPAEPPLALTATFHEDRTKQTQWRAFLQKGKLGADAKDLGEVIAVISGFLMPPAVAAATNKPFAIHWPAGGPWKPSKKGGHV